MATDPIPLDANGQTNSAYANYLLNLKYTAVTNDMFIAATPDAYDAVVTNGLIDYTFVATSDTNYPPTVQYFSAPTSAWDLLAPRLPGYPLFNGLPAVRTLLPSERPRINLTNIVLNYDTNFPVITDGNLNLSFTEDPALSGGTNAFIQSAFSHAATDFYRTWSLADDPNLKAAAQVEPENVQLTLVLSNYVYDSNVGPLTNNTPNNLLNNAALSLATTLIVTQQSGPITEDSLSFVRFQNASLSLRITRPPDNFSSGEAETMQLQKLDLTTNRTYAVRSSRYQCQVTPVLSGGNSTLRFIVSVKLDPPVEFSVRKPLRRDDRIALPLHVIDREKFWQVDSGEYLANLFKEVAIENPAQVQPEIPGYIVDSILGYTSTNGSRILATDSNYAARANALFWKTPEGRIVQNPRVILGDISVVLKDPSGREESPAFKEKRYVAPVTNEFFNDLYLDAKDLANLSWKAKIRPQAKEHAYVKVYGSVGGNWTLSYRRREAGQLSGLLPVDSGLLTWTTITSGNGRGQNQFLTYWDVTELNGPHLLRLESGESPDNSFAQAEVKYLDVMLGQHLPGKNNPVFSPGSQAETASLFSMHGRTQLTSAKEERGADDLFFTVNPIKIEERPFSLGTNGLIPLGERVQLLPHTDYNPFSVNFYIDQQEYSLYDKFRLYHQLEEGQLVEITSLPPSVRPKYTLIQGYVEHTSIVGFLPNPSLRYCTLNVPGLSQDGVIRVAGAVDLYGTDNNGVKNEDLTVAIVVSPTTDFYQGQVKARLTTGTKAEFPIAAEAGSTNALIPTSWTPAQPAQTFHVFAVVISTNDDWLTLNRPLTNTDAGQHLFNVSRTTVTMTTNINNSLTISNGQYVFSPNGDGVTDTMTFLINFQREGLVQLEFRNEVGQSVHLQSVPLGTNGQATFVWDGNITGQGALSTAPDGIYTVTARYAGGTDVSESATAVIEVRAFSKYFGQLNPAGITNTTGLWRTLWTHTGGTVYTNDIIRIQYSDSTSFAMVRGERGVARSELSALFDDTPTDLTAFVPDASGRITLYYRLKVTDEVANVGLSPVVSLGTPQRGRLTVASVTPAPGATNVSTEPVISILLSNASPFGVAELQNMVHLSPSVPWTVALSSNALTISVTPGAPFAPGAAVIPSLQLYPTAVLPGPDTFAWSFSVMPSNLVNRTLVARLVGIPDTLDGIGASNTAFLTVSNAGNVPARVSVLAGTPTTNVLTVTTPTNAVLVFPSNEVSVPISLTVTSQYNGMVSVPLTGMELSMGAWTSLWMNVSVSSVTSAPTVQVWDAKLPTNPFVTRFNGLSQGDGTVSTLARVNGGSWWVVSQGMGWTFDATFTSDGDVLEIVATDAKNRSSAAYSYVFAAPDFDLYIGGNLTLSWNAQLGRVYTVQWSTNLVDWTTAPGSVLQLGPTINVTPGVAPVQVTDAPSGRISVNFTPEHPGSTSGTNRFYRISTSY